MAILLKIPAAIMLGLYSSVGLHYYSICISRTKNEMVRLLIFGAAIALFIVGPLAVCTGLAGHLFHRVFGNLPAILTLSWLGVVLIYLVLNWRAFDQRLRTPTGRPFDVMAGQ